MRIVKRVLSTYSADNFGVCSALYELGGLVVMHDASGCNSTYNTHDEPRWYDMDSMVFISGLTEKDAIFGNDEVLIKNLCETAEKLHPKFVCICGGPLPHIIGTDFKAVAKAVSRRTGLPAFGIQTNGMDAYTSGAGEALSCLVDLMEDVERGAAHGSGVARAPRGTSEKRNARVAHARDAAAHGSGVVRAPRGTSATRTAHGSGRIPGTKKRVNILGATPLDFSLNGSVQAIQGLLEDNGFSVRSVWAMGDTLENILSSGDADVNLVISATGYPAAKRMRERFGIPYVIGCPVGRAGTERIVRELVEATTEEAEVGMTESGHNGTVTDARVDRNTREILLIGEPVMMKSMAETILAGCLPAADEEDAGGMENYSVRIISPMRGLPREIAEGTQEIVLEDDLREACRNADFVIADPLYARLLPEDKGKFIKLPHVAYSGRFYEREIPILIGDRLDAWLSENALCH